MSDEDWNISVRFLTNEDGTVNALTLKEMLNRLHNEIRELKTELRKLEMQV